MTTEQNCAPVPRHERFLEVVLPAVQTHARNAHGMELSAQLVLSLAGTKGAIFAGTAPRHEPEEAVGSPPTERRLG